MISTLQIDCMKLTSFSAVIHASLTDNKQIAILKDKLKAAIVMLEVQSRCPIRRLVLNDLAGGAIRRLEVRCVGEEAKV